MNKRIAALWKFLTYDIWRITEDEVTRTTFSVYNIIKTIYLCINAICEFVSFSDQEWNIHRSGYDYVAVDGPQSNQQYGNHLQPHLAGEKGAQHVPQNNGLLLYASADAHSAGGVRWSFHLHEYDGEEPRRLYPAGSRSASLWCASSPSC